MYSDAVIKEAVESGRIKLSYSFFFEEYKWVNQPAEFVHQSDRALHMFQERLTRSRISLHLGCLVQPLTSTRIVRKSQRFDSVKGVVDLRRCDPDGWILPPGMSAVAFTNEWIELPPNVEGLIVSRVGDYNSGLIAAGSYVDSTWRGLIKVCLTNQSKRAVQLYTGLEIGRLFIFGTERPTENDHGVTKDSGHYEKTWESILNEKIDPFPQSRQAPSKFNAARIRNLNEVVKNYVAIPLSALLAGICILGYRAAEDLASTERIQQSVAALQQASPISGLQSVVVQSGKTVGSARALLPPEVGGWFGRAIIQLQYVGDGPKPRNLSGILINESSGTYLQIDVGQSPVNQQRIYDVSYVIDR